MNLKSNRNVNNEVDIDYGPKPRVWKVYNRKKTKRIIGGDVAENA
jgi:hypothetical protein